MEPRLARYVPSHEERIEILDHVYCEAKRDPTLALPPDLVLALIDVESRFDNWAVSPVGAVGLMQVMPFWPRQLGRAESAGAHRAQYPHGLRDPALLPARGAHELGARARALQRQRRPQHLSRPGDAALAAGLALLEDLEAPRLKAGRACAPRPLSSSSLDRRRVRCVGPRCSHCMQFLDRERSPCAQHLDRAIRQVARVARQMPRRSASSARAVAEEHALDLPDDAETARDLRSQRCSEPLVRSGRRRSAGQGRRARWRQSRAPRRRGAWPPAPPGAPARILCASRCDSGARDRRLRGIQIRRGRAVRVRPPWPRRLPGAHRSFPAREVRWAARSGSRTPTNTAIKRNIS